MTGRHDTARPRRRIHPILASTVGALGLSILVVPLSDITVADASETSAVDAPSAAATADGTRHVDNTTQISGARIVQAAAEEHGHPYTYGADGPGAFDCSGLTQYVFERFGVSLPHNAAAQYRVVDRVAKSDIRLGDLVFFYNDDGIYHVGIYAGNKQIWAAGSPGEVVRMHDIWTDRFLVGRP